MTDYERMRKALVQQTRLMSASEQMKKAPAYQELKAVGQMAVQPLLIALRDNERGAMAIMTLLEDITGENPAEDAAGDVERATLDWIDWGEAHSLL